MATIKVRQNCSLLVDGEDVKLIDWNGNEYQLEKRPFALCRCGHSMKKPFCDGTHRHIGFQGAEAALCPEPPEHPAEPASERPAK
jgi:CDGSH-type Zn-finger protein